MKEIENYLFEEMTKAMEKCNEAELQHMIAEQEFKAVSAAYRAFMNNKGGKQ